MSTAQSRGETFNYSRNYIIIKEGTALLANYAYTHSEYSYTAERLRLWCVHLHGELKMNSATYNMNSAKLNLCKPSLKVSFDSEFSQAGKCKRSFDQLSSVTPIVLHYSLKPYSIAISISNTTPLCSMPGTEQTTCCLPSHR